MPELLITAELLTELLLTIAKPMTAALLVLVTFTAPLLMMDAVVPAEVIPSDKALVADGAELVTVTVPLLVAVAVPLFE